MHFTSSEHFVEVTALWTRQARSLFVHVFVTMADVEPFSLPLGTNFYWSVVEILLHRSTMGLGTRLLRRRSYI
jgi:hypothetical protein